MKLNGLRLDGKFSDSVEHTWAYAKNVLISRGFDEFENEPGDTLVSSAITGNIIGRISTPTEVLLFVYQSGHSYIIPMSTPTTPCFTADVAYLDFNPATGGQSAIYIEGVHCYNNEGDLVIAFTTGLHKPMLINITHAIATPISITSATQLKLYYLFPEFDHNNFTLTTGSATTISSIINGGTLETAAYFVSVTYELEPNVNTNFGVISSPIFITEDDSTTEYRQFKGSASLVKTTKALHINITELDVDYSYFKLVIIQKTTTGTNTFITNRIKITGTTNTVLIDDLTKLIPFDINEVIISSPAFSTVASITQVNKRLRIGNLGKPTKLSISDIYENILTPRVLTATVSRTAYLVTVTSTAHGLVDGQIVIMYGWSDTGFNGHFVITRTGDNTFTYVSTVSASTTPTGGTCKVDILSINWINDDTTSLTNTLNSYKDATFIFNTRTFRSDEVYALYLGLRLKTGGYYGIYHIPGRAPITSTELTAHTHIDGEVADTINFRIGSTADKIGNYYGYMGYWENADETYPTQFGSKLSGQKVRHHRFPSAGQLHTWKTGVLHNTPATFEPSIAYTSFLQSSDKYYCIITLNNTLNLNSGTWTPAASPSTLVNTYKAYYPQTVNLYFSIDVNVRDYGSPGSYSITIVHYIASTGGTTTYGPTTATADTNPDTLALTVSQSLDLQKDDEIRITIFALTDDTAVVPEVFTDNIASPSSIEFLTYDRTYELLALRVSLNWNNVPSNIKDSLDAIVDGWEIFYAKRTLNNQLMLDQSVVIADEGGYRFYGFDSMVNLLNVEPTHVKSELFVDTTDYTTVHDAKEVSNYSKETLKITNLNSITYLPAYNTATVPNNDNKENCYHFKTTSGSFNMRLANLINIKNNVYLNFSSHELVSTGIVKQLLETSAFSLYGGDTFINYISVLTFPTGVLTAPTILYFPVESILNAGMRYEGENEYEKVYPITDISLETSGIKEFIVAMNDAGVANVFYYNNDYHLLNTFRQDEINTELTSTLSKYPNRIYSSMPQPLESTSLYWKKFKIGDYFDMVNNKGPIYKMIGNEYIIYIQTAYSIFRGIVIDRLVSNNVDVALKSAEMFDRPLEELLDADGNYIKPWNREGTIITPYGLIVADLDRGCVYVISDKATEITKLGIEDWFRNTVKTKMRLTVAKKEAIGYGVSLGYDDIYKRLLLTVRNESIAVTSITGVNGLITVVTSVNHLLTTGDTVTLTGWKLFNGTFIVNVLNATTFTYSNILTLFTRWSNGSYPSSFITDGLDITYAIGNNGSNAAAYPYNLLVDHYHAIPGETVTITGTFHKIAGTGNIRLTVNADSTDTYITLAEGVNTLSVVILEPGTLYYIINNASWDTTSYSFTNVTITNSLVVKSATPIVLVDRWVNTDYPTFASTGLNITNAIGNSGISSIAFLYNNTLNHYNALPGEVITVVGTFNKISGTGNIKFNLYTDYGNTEVTLVNGVNTISLVVPFYLTYVPVSFFITNSDLDDTRFSFTSVSVTTTGPIDGTLKTISDTTLSFSFEKMIWIALHSYIPDKYTWNSNGLYTFYSGNIYKMLSGNYGLQNATYYPSIVDFIFNDNTHARFLLKNIKWVTNIESNNINYWNETITNLLVYSKNLCTELITIAKQAYGYNSGTYAMEVTGNTLFKDGEWMFNDIKDYLATPNSVILNDNFEVIDNNINLLKEWYDKSQFITKFVIVRVSFTNTSSNKKLRISNISIDAKKIL